MEKDIFLLNLSPCMLSVCIYKWSVCKHTLGVLGGMQGSKRGVTCVIGS